MDREQVIEEITNTLEDGDNIIALLDGLVDDGILEFIGVYPIN